MLIILLLWVEYCIEKGVCQNLGATPIRWLTPWWTHGKNTLFCSFSYFFSVCDRKRCSNSNKMILTNESHANHTFSGQNIQQTFTSSTHFIYCPYGILNNLESTNLFSVFQAFLYGKLQTCVVFFCGI